MTIPYPHKIVSGGQTGADRGGLDAGLALGIPVGGYCPAGRRSEDGTIPDRYPLMCTTHSGYDERTRLNVLHSAATIIFNQGASMSSGSRNTQVHCEALKRPYLLMRLPASCWSAPSLANIVAGWLAQVRPEILNVAGNRESKAQGLQAAVAGILQSAITLAPQKEATGPIVYSTIVTSETLERLAPSALGMLDLGDMGTERAGRHR